MNWSAASTSLGTGRRTSITSAPKSASTIEANGPGPIVLTSITVTPASGPAGRAAEDVNSPSRRNLAAVKLTVIGRIEEERRAVADYQSRATGAAGRARRERSARFVPRHAQDQALRGARRRAVPAGRDPGVRAPVGRPGGRPGRDVLRARLG